MLVVLNKVLFCLLLDVCKYTKHTSLQINFLTTAVSLDTSRSDVLYASISMVCSPMEGLLTFKDISPEDELISKSKEGTEGSLTSVQKEKVLSRHTLSQF